MVWYVLSLYYKWMRERCYRYEWGEKCLFFFYFALFRVISRWRFRVKKKMGVWVEKMKNDVKAWWRVSLEFLNVRERERVLLSDDFTPAPRTESRVSCRCYLWRSIGFSWKSWHCLVRKSKIRSQSCRPVRRRRTSKRIRPAVEVLVVVALQKVKVVTIG